MVTQEIYCIDCDHIFAAVDGAHCPDCGSNRTEVLSLDWDRLDGFFEGDFPTTSNSDYKVEE